MQKRNIPGKLPSRSGSSLEAVVPHPKEGAMKFLKQRTQRVDEKNGVICLVIMSTSRVIVVKMSKTAHFCIFYWWQQKSSHSLGKIFKYIGKTLLSSFRKWYVKRLWSYRLCDIKGRNIKKPASKKYRNPA